MATAVMFFFFLNQNDSVSHTSNASLLENLVVILILKSQSSSISITPFLQLCTQFQSFHAHRLTPIIKKKCYFSHLQALTVTKRCSERGHFLGWPGVAILIMYLKSFLCITIMILILILELVVVLHRNTIVLSTSAVNVTMVIIKPKLKWDSDFRSTRYRTGREDP